jgi:hypothetical protein
MSTDNLLPPEMGDEEFPDLDMTPVEEVITPTRREKDLELWHTWNNDKKPKHLVPLLAALKGTMQKEVNRAAGSLPKHVLDAAAKKWAVVAIQKYNPNQGVALATYVTNYLAKIRRLNYQHQNMVRMPEEKTLQFSTFQGAVSHLTETLNRPPTDNELASHLEWKPTAVKKFKDMLYNDHYESGSEKATEAHEFDFGQVKLDYIKENLDDQERIILDSLFLPEGKRMSNPQLAAKLGVNENRLSYLKNKLKKKIHAYNRELGK